MPPEGPIDLTADDGVGPSHGQPAPAAPAAASAPKASTSGAVPLHASAAAPVASAGTADASVTSALALTPRQCRRRSKPYTLDHTVGSDVDTDEDEAPHAVCERICIVCHSCNTRSQSALACDACGGCMRFLYDELTARKPSGWQKRRGAKALRDHVRDRLDTVHSAAFVHAFVRGRVDLPCGEKRARLNAAFEMLMQPVP